MATWGVPASRLLGFAELIGEVAAAPITAGGVAALRRQHGPRFAAMVVAIAAEQQRARQKLGAGTWMVTAQSIRQATDQTVAAYKAELLAAGAVFDLCGGIGGDAIALARRGTVATIDYDPQLSAMAAANLHTDRLMQRSGGGRAAADHPNAVDRAAVGSPAAAAPQWGDAIAICADVTRYPIPRDVAVHIDPDRRPEQRRTVRPSNYLPSLEFVAGLVSGRQAAIIKLAPAAALQQDIHGAELARRQHRQWISLDLSVREQAVLCGDVIAAAGVQPGGRSAVRLMRHGPPQCFAIDAHAANRLESIDHGVNVTDLPAGVIIDFDPAVRGGGLSAALALDRGLTALGGPAGFFCSDVLPAERSLMQCFETLWSGPADRKQIKSELRRNQWVLQSVKVRGSHHDPAELQRTLQWTKQPLTKQPSGGTAPVQPHVDGLPEDAAEGQRATAAAVTLLIGRHRHGVYAVIARKVADLPQGR